MLKELALTLSILLFVTMCSIGQNKAHANSSTLTKDLRESTGYAEAIEIFNSDNRADLHKKADRAIDNIIKVTVGELKKRKQKALAAQIESEYRDKYKGAIFQFKPGMRDVGDHEFIVWLKTIHDKIHAVLTDKICRAIRTHDLWTLAYTIPVVFSCVDNVDYPEYYKHYSPFLGIVAYWVSYGTCAVASMGSGAVFLCGLVGMGCEVATVQLIVPLTATAAHSRACETNLFPALVDDLP